MTDDTEGPRFRLFSSGMNFSARCLLGQKSNAGERKAYSPCCFNTRCHRKLAEPPSPNDFLTAFCGFRSHCHNPADINIAKVIQSFVKLCQLPLANRAVQAAIKHSEPESATIPGSGAEVSR